MEIDQGPGLTNYLTKHKGNLSLLNFSLTLWYPFLSEFIKGWESLALLSKHLHLSPWKDNKMKEIQKGHLYELGVFVCLFSSDCNKAHVVLDIRHSPTQWFLSPQHDWHFPFYSKTQITDNQSGLCLPPKVSRSLLTGGFSQCQPESQNCWGSTERREDPQRHGKEWWNETILNSSRHFYGFCFVYANEDWMWLESKLL